MKTIALVSSAGGLAAAGAVLAGLPADLPAPVVVLQHISPEHISLLPQLLQRATAMPVVPAADGEPLRRSHVYVAPPGFHTLITPGGRFALVLSGSFPPSRPSADLLLATLAMAAGPDAIAVVMTGNGSDGATGASVVHQQGGVVLATDMATSEHFAMPAATIARDRVTSAVLPLPELAQHLTGLVVTQVAEPAAWPSDER